MNVPLIGTRRQRKETGSKQSKTNHYDVIFTVKNEYQGPSINQYVDSKTAIFDPIPPCRLCSKSSLGLPPSPYRDDIIYGWPLRVRSRLEKRTINLATAHKRNIIFLCSLTQLMNPLTLDAKGGFYSEMAAEFVIFVKQAKQIIFLS